MKKPSIRQRLTARDVVGKGLSVAAAMRKNGYREAYITSGKLPKTETWEQITQRYLPDKLLNKVARQGLRAVTPDDKAKPDYSVRQRYLETGLKMRNKLSDRVDITSGGQVVAFQMINPKDRVKSK